MSSRRTWRAPARLRLANWLYNVGAQGRHRLRHHRPRHRLRSAARQHQGASSTAPKFTWIGSANNEVSICVAWHTCGVTKFEDLLTKELVVGGTSSSADTDQFPKIVNGVLGTKMKIVTGYPGGNEVGLAMERGEVQGRCGWSWSSVKSTHQKWIDDKQFTILVQLALDKHPDLPDVPLVIDLAKTDEQRQILRLIFARQVMGRPFLAPPGVPQDRADALRKAFMETMADKDFLRRHREGQDGDHAGVRRQAGRAGEGNLRDAERTGRSGRRVYRAEVNPQKTDDVMDAKITNYTGWQSDVIVDCIKRYDFPYITLNPGASFRGLHDSLVNYGDNQPPMMLCNHEEIAVQIAHGYAKASGKPMAVILHNLVGLLHACMAIYYAYPRPRADLHHGRHRPDG